MNLCINMNDKAQVILTKTGARIYNEKMSEFLKTHYDYDNNDILAQEGKILICPIWELFQIFGDQMMNGMPEVPFINNEMML